MTELYQRYFLKCPYHRAKAFLARSLEVLADSGLSEIMQLRVPIRQLGEAGGLHKDVVVTYNGALDPLHFDQPWRIRWVPHDSGPYPSFDGTLTVRADEDYNGSILELHGEYEPPLGAAGLLFDAVVGTRIASATARELLRQIGEQLERQYADEESAKQVSHDSTHG